MIYTVTQICYDIFNITDLGVIMKEITIYTDGACSGNPGPGGYGVILEYNGAFKEFSEGFLNTTNNRMELSGVIAGLEALKESCKVKVYTDSRYVVDSIEKGWVYKWEENNWRKSNKEPALNVDLWEHLLALLEEHEVEFCWIQGHAGHPQNERCDKLATTATQNIISK